VALIDSKGKKQILHFIQDDKAEDKPYSEIFMGIAVPH
jgi:hypothetical protein